MRIKKIIAQIAGAYGANICSQKSLTKCPLSLIDAEINGDAAYDYNRLTELDEKKNALEERLFEIYEELEG